MIRDEDNDPMRTRLWTSSWSDDKITIVHLQHTADNNKILVLLSATTKPLLHKRCPHQLAQSILFRVQTTLNVQQLVMGPELQYPENPEVSEQNRRGQPHAHNGKQFMFVEMFGGRGVGSHL